MHRSITHIPESSVAHYSTAVIGSSPLSLLEALHQRCLGEKVVVIEAADQLGGAWRECSVFGLQRAEIAPHAFTYNAVTYAYFEKELNVRMVPMAPVPFYIVFTKWGSVWIPYHFAPLIACIAVPLHFLRNKAFRERFAEVKEEYFGRMSDAARQILQWVFSRNKPRFKYPVGGTLELIDRLAEQLDCKGVDVKTSTRLCGLSKGPEGGLTLDLRGDTVTVQRVFLTCHQKIDWISDGLKKYEVQYVNRKYTMLHLLLKSKHRPRISYALAKRNPAFNLISDITPYIADIPTEYYVMVARLNQWGEFNRESVEKFVGTLQDEQIVATDAVLQDFLFSNYEQGTISKPSMAEIQARLGPAVTIFRSTNHSNCIGDNAARWTAGVTRLSQGESSFSRPQ